MYRAASGSKPEATRQAGKPVNGLVQSKQQGNSPMRLMPNSKRQHLTWYVGDEACLVPTNPLRKIKINVALACADLAGRQYAPSTLHSK